MTIQSCNKAHNSTEVLLHLTQDHRKDVCQLLALTSKYNLLTHSHLLPDSLSFLIWFGCSFASPTPFFLFENPGIMFDDVFPLFLIFCISERLEMEMSWFSIARISSVTFLMYCTCEMSSSPLAQFSICTAELKYLQSLPSSSEILLGRCSWSTWV